MRISVLYIDRKRPMQKTILVIMINRDFEKE